MHEVWIKKTFVNRYEFFLNVWKETLFSNMIPRVILQFRRMAKNVSEIRLYLHRHAWMCLSTAYPWDITSSRCNTDGNISENSIRIITYW